MMKPFLTEIKWGVVFTVFTLLWMFFERSIGWHDEHIADHPRYTMLFIFPAVLIYALAMMDFRRRQGGSFEWKEGFMFGVRTTVVIVLLSPLTQWITHAFISPHFFENAIRYGVEHDLATRESLETYFNIKSYIVQSILMGLLMGVMVSALLSLMFQKRGGIEELRN